MNNHIIHNFSKCIFFILIINLFGCSSSKESRYEQTPKKEDQKNKVVPVLKTMEVRERETIKKLKISTVDRISFGYDSQGKLVGKGKVSSAKYDIKGFLVETITFDEKGRVQNRYEYRYNGKGFRTESLRYDAQDKPDKKYTYEYDEHGNKIKSIRYDMKDNAEKYYLYEYDSNLNLISDEWYNSSDDLEYKIETEYDNEGDKIASNSYNGNGTLISKYIFRYDDKKNLIEEQKYDNDGKPVGIIQYLYKYY